MPKSPLKLGGLLKILSQYNVVVMGKSGSSGSRRGKGSELILLLPEKEGSKRGPQYPIKNHGMGKDVPIPVIEAILRRFNINKKDFWGY